MVAFVYFVLHNTKVCFIFASGIIDVDSYNINDDMIENVKTQMRKGMLEYCLLTMLSRDEMYAGEIMAFLKSVNMIAVEGTIYPLLSRMKNLGLLTYRWQESTGGPPRKYFCITQTGRDLLAELDQEWTIMRDAIDTIVNNQE